MAFDGDDIFGADLFSAAMDILGDAGLENDLGHALAVAEIDEDDGAMVAPPMDPSHQNRALAVITGAELSASVCAAKVAEKVEL
jgi:hypothetical protein